MIEAYPLQWPEGWKRYYPRRQARAAFKTTFGLATEGLMQEIRRMGGKSVVLSTNVPLRRDGLPYASARPPADPGAAVYFVYDEKQICLACDRWDRVQDNIQAIRKTVEAIRGIERWCASDMIQRAFTGFIALPASLSDSWRDVLGFGSHTEVSLEAVEARYRDLAFHAHPDRGGDQDRMARINQARAKARQELSSSIKEAGE